MFSNRVDLDTFRPVQETEPEYNERKERFEASFPAKYRVLHVGRRTEQKNLKTVIHALRLLGDDFVGIFVGLGKRDTFLRLAKKLNVENRVYFVDSIPNSELRWFYSFADVFCTPSLWEGFGIVFIEALGNIFPNLFFFVDFIGII